MNAFNKAPWSFKIVLNLKSHIHIYNLVLSKGGIDKFLMKYPQNKWWMLTWKRKLSTYVYHLHPPENQVGHQPTAEWGESPVWWHSWSKAPFPHPSLSLGRGRAHRDTSQHVLLLLSGHSCVVPESQGETWSSSLWLFCWDCQSHVRHSQLQLLLIKELELSGEIQHSRQRCY